MVTFPSYWCCGQIARRSHSVPEDSQVPGCFCSMLQDTVTGICREPENSGRKFEEATMNGARLKHYGWAGRGGGVMRRGRGLWLAAPARKSRRVRSQAG